MLSEDSPKQSYRLLRAILPRKTQPFLRGFRKRFLTTSRPRREPFRSVYPFTQCHPARQQNLLTLAERVDANNIPGAIVECGVLDGGTAALLAFGTSKSRRPVHLFDSWEGLPAISEQDGDSERWSGQVVGSPKRVLTIFKQLNVDLGRVTFHKGWFNETFPKAQIDQIAVLHIDADFYDSVKLALEYWGPKVSPGGYIQLDDYSSFIGCKRAVDEYLAAHPSFRLQSPDGILFYISIPVLSG